ncbi:MAG: DinB family protein [Candidatus Thiodiazotropha lotti]|nr:DinB family protein [Candidatus Thiodiazotropha lotti]MCG8000390.1 DinB family protein [Candidatus Thiodiazotropha lotti]MCW4183950.1 DinB family protein [Candidatus Thiodiazotropha weberae]MCW4192160.1 DinB family protein [Candidatus Thiodiazotropha weberae]
MKNNQIDISLASPTNRELLVEEFRRVRNDTEALCLPLSVDDYQTQSIVQTSPPKWLIAHVTWFFEAFVFADYDDEYECFDERWAFTGLRLAEDG